MNCRICAVCLLAVAVAVTSSPGCATIIAPIPEGPHLAMQTLLHTYNVDTGLSYVDVVSVDTSGRRVQDYPQSYGTVTQFGATRSDSRGLLYVANARLNADWTSTWESTLGGCFADESIPFYAQHGVIYYGNCYQITYTLQAFDYSYLQDGTEIYTGGSDKLGPGETLYPADSRTSADGRFHLHYQADGNLVLYIGSSPIWSSGTAGASAGQTTMQGDGNLVVYDAGGNPVWWSGTDGNSGAHAVVTSNGMVVISTGTNVLWNTPTCCYGP